ncbi:hypothetical protein JRO89_XSUnG0106000 [Xanthoceras sorbifolium]|uniref:Uncharacterized protein n=1 Tax=Xanthoceras sorbifolium TaxID=99658 RepID=A0ABQ8GYK4_9ROSI|nr:hypothetical protein JRO89_XSUnG0106000 [Xanthoceras sorbifolium]
MLTILICGKRGNIYSYGDTDDVLFTSVSLSPFQVKRKYRIAPSLPFSDRRRNPSLFLEGRQRSFPRVDKDDVNIPTKSQIDLDLAKMRSMTPQEAAAAASQAVAEAEAAIVEAEEAAREAEAAEADAEAAQAFAEAAMKTLKGRNNPKMILLERSLSLDFELSVGFEYAQASTLEFQCFMSFSELMNLCKMADDSSLMDILRMGNNEPLTNAFFD